MVTDDTTGRVSLDPSTQQSFDLRWEHYLPDLWIGLSKVYGDRADETLQRICAILLRRCAERPDDLKRLDEARLLEPDWLQQETMIGYTIYTDHFSGTLNGITDHLDHLSEMGVRYLHLMPILQPRQGINDGGYAVADHHSIRADLGTMDDLANLTAVLRAHGISLAIDLTVNHVAAEHEWAQLAREGQQKYRDYFHILSTHDEVNAWEKNLPETFPEFSRGNFTWDDDCQGWVWTTFNDFQWDLNWANPDVFCEFLDVMCVLANRGVEVFRLDAIAFIWKTFGTTCQNLPQVHDITQSLRQAMRVVAPSVAFAAATLSGPDDLVAYFGRGRHWGKTCEVSYHNTLMVQLWNALATRDVSLMETTLSRIPDKPSTATWASYIRCHDDIEWTIDDAREIGLDPVSHRRFLSDFYSGHAPGSFARGLIFHNNPVTGESRISGSLASLAGLELALEADDPAEVDAAIARIVMLQTAVLGYGGVPLIWMGDEVGILNGEWQHDPDHADDNRWVHRPLMDWSMVEQAHAEPHSIPGRIWSGVRRAINARRRSPEFHASVETVILPSPNQKVMMWGRPHPQGRMIELYNVSEHEVWFPMEALRSELADVVTEVLSGFEYDLTPMNLRLGPYQCLWLSDRSQD
ncbi:alpha-amylase [Cutibacterium sp. WCA-380-WT-3A]|uniref:Alpha-amylase n=1 Tax=Cutibacterium porci TaxID=2605781 RepID=A0A7K0J708_9ACTN|nr:alpha-amylase family protein [Cutibacterium porci]MSS45746.1 alpha-amylase [Cutibacterium porci]